MKWKALVCETEANDCGGYEEMLGSCTYEVTVEAPGRVAAVLAVEALGYDNEQILSLEPV